jgi:hypothetical protein
MRMLPQFVRLMTLCDATMSEFRKVISLAIVIKPINHILFGRCAAVCFENFEFLMVPAITGEKKSIT